MVVAEADDDQIHHGVDRMDGEVHHDYLNDEEEA